MKKLLILLALAWATLTSHAIPVATEDADTATSRPVTSVYGLGVGHTDVLATYLSPLHYTGTSYSIFGSWRKAMPFNPRKAVMQFDAHVDYCDMLNPAETARMVGLSGGFDWGLSWRKTLPWQLQLTAGGSIGIEGGAYYLLRNGNNPVQAMATASLAARASLSRHFMLGRLPVLIRDEVAVPSIGLFFCPGYGETYYEIYLGNHSGLVHPAWWGNNFRLDNHLSATLDFGRTAMTVGYRFQAHTQWANNLNTEIFTHYFTIGVIPGGIGLKKKNCKMPRQTIYSVY